VSRPGQGVGQQAGAQLPSAHIVAVKGKSIVHQAHGRPGPGLFLVIRQAVPDHGLDQAVDRQAVGFPADVRQGIALERSQGPVPGQGVGQDVWEGLGQVFSPFLEQGEGNIIRGQKGAEAEEV
jgi:hypothetical protein